MDSTVLAEIDKLSKLKTGALRAKYRAVLGAETRSSNKQFLIRRIAWRLQARSEGDLNERAKQRAVDAAGRLWIFIKRRRRSGDVVR